jgi:hypothetical protein
VRTNRATFIFLELEGIYSPPKRGQKVIIISSIRRFYLGGRPPANGFHKRDFYEVKLDILSKTFIRDHGCTYEYIIFFFEFDIYFSVPLMLSLSL